MKVKITQCTDAELPVLREALADVAEVTVARGAVQEDHPAGRAMLMVDCRGEHEYTALFKCAADLPLQGIGLIVPDQHA